MRRSTYWLNLILLAFAMLAIPLAAPAQISVGLSVHIGPPPLPVYVQPVCPAPGYIWTPGFWAYGSDGYYWVPGTWVEAPEVGVLWTPGYWGWGGGGYIFHAGYWGPHVGFYGGINYGFGYGGVGFVGGAWRGGSFAYNTAVTNVNTTVIHTTYVDRTVIHNTTINRVSYNGGTGGIAARPTAREQAVEHERHIPASSMQVQHEQAARSDRSLLASVNHGRPAVAATARPGAFHGEGVVAAGPSSNHNVPRPDSANTNRPSSNMANNHAGPNGGVPRPPANSTANTRSNNARLNNVSTNADRSEGARSNANRSNNAPNEAHANASHNAPPRPPQPSHAAKQSAPKGNQRSEDRKR